MQILGIVASGSGAKYWIGLINSLDTIRKIACDSNDNIYTVGSSSNNAILMSQKTDGSINWQKQISGAFLYYNSSNVDSSDNIYAGGYVSGSPIGVFTKYNSTGTLQFQRTLTASSTAVVTDISVDSSGNIYVAGQEGGSGGSVADPFIAKYNSSGTLQSQKYFEASSSPSIESFSSIDVDSSGNIYLSSSFNGSIVKLDSSFNILWSKNTGILNTRSVIDSSGNTYVCGYYTSEGGYVMKFDNSGSLQWQRKLNISSYDFITLDSSGNVYVGGKASITSAIVAKYNNSGAIQWQRSIGIGTGVAAVQGLVVDNKDKLMVTLSSDDGNFIMAIPSSGNLTGNYTVGGISFLYSASSFTDAAGTRTPASLSLTSGNATTTSATSTYTESTSTLTVTKTLI